MFEPKLSESGEPVRWHRDTVSVSMTGFNVAPILEVLVAASAGVESAEFYESVARRAKPTRPTTRQVRIATELAVPARQLSGRTSTGHRTARAVLGREDRDDLASRQLLPARRVPGRAREDLLEGRHEGEGPETEGGVGLDLLGIVAGVGDRRCQVCFN